jgi:protein-S-isoprenylcysteine O-methyltransferase Ste14
LFVEKTLAAVAAAVAIAAATAVSVVAAAFALYAVLFPHLGAAGSAAVLAVTFAILALVGGLLAARKAEGGRRPESQAAHEDGGLITKLFEIAKDKPLLAAGAAVAAGIFAIRNPAILTAVLSAFLNGGGPPPPKR